MKTIPCYAGKTALLLAVLLPLSLVLGLDLCSKKLVNNQAMHLPLDLGLVGLVTAKNFGLAGGLYSEISPTLREVSLVVVAAFLMFIYFMVQYLIPTRNLVFRSGLSFLMGGIVGNVIDRMLHGFVTDFIMLAGVSSHSPIFNLADFFQLVGYGMIIFCVLTKRKALWAVNDLRNNYWINYPFQFSYCMNLIACGLGFSLISGSFTYTYFKIAFRQFQGNNALLGQQVLLSYVLVFGLVTLAFLLVLFIFGMILSHRIAGPVFAFEKFLNSLAETDAQVFRLRTKDEFKHLEKLAAELQKKVKPSKC